MTVLVTCIFLIALSLVLLTVLATVGAGEVDKQEYPVLVTKEY